MPGGLRKGEDIMVFKSSIRSMKTPNGVGLICNNSEKLLAWTIEAAIDETRGEALGHGRTPRLVGSGAVRIWAFKKRLYPLWLDILREAQDYPAVQG